MRRVVVLFSLLALAACSDDRPDDERAVIDGNLGTIEVVVEEGSPGVAPGDRLVDAAVAADGVLYLALRDGAGRHRLVSLREGRDPRVLADESNVERFAPTAVAVDSRLRVVYVASGDEVLKLEDSHGAEGAEQLVVKRGPPEPTRPGSYTPTAEIGVPRYMTFDGRTNGLYVADLCRVVRFGIRTYETAEVAQVSAGPGDCSANRDLITGLAVDQRTGDVYVGSGDELRRVAPDGTLSPVTAKGDEDDVAKPVTGLLSGRSLAVNSFGDVLVTASGGVLRVRPDGTLDQVRGIEEGPDTTHSGYPGDVFRTVNNEDWVGLDGAGNLYVATRSLPGRETDTPVRIRKVIAGAL